MKKKKTIKGKKKGAAGGSRASRRIVGLMIYAAVLLAIVPVVYYGRRLVPGASPLTYVMALFTGLVTGASGNPALIGISAELIGHVDFASGVACNTPAAIVGKHLAREQFILIGSLLMGATVVKDGLRSGALRYEPVMLMAPGTILGMAAAWWASSTSPLFNDLLAGAANGPWFTGPILFMILALLAVKWITGSNSVRRHWLLSLAAGPVIGFWIGYLGDVWMVFLPALVLFVYVIILGESVSGAIAGIPLVIAPAWGARLFFENQGAWEIFSGAADVNPVALALIVVGFCGAHLWAWRLTRVIPPTARRAVFYTLSISFLLYALFNL